jgi:hypothetical protein
MANEIKTRPQGYQGPRFDNEQQREEWEARARQIATTILNQIQAAPADVWQSWAMEYPAAIIWEGRAGLIFRVNGLQHRGPVVVTLDEGRDLYDVVTLQEIDGETVTTKQQTGVFCDDLAAVIDAMVERPQTMTDEEYRAALRAQGDPLQNFLLTKAEQGQRPNVVQF